jgi:hypothetical protein
MSRDADGLHPTDQRSFLAMAKFSSVAARGSGNVLPADTPMEAPPPAPVAAADRSHNLSTSLSAKAAKISPVTSEGPRKLIRPSLAARGFSHRASAAKFFPVPVREERVESFSSQASRAEIFYLQKQVQQRTRMVFVLEGNDRIEGYIEWYDSHAIKVQGSCRTLIYKSSIKYMYKAGESFRP